MSIYHGYTESPEKVRARWEAWQRRAAEYEEQQRILTNITPEAHEEYIANLVHSAYGEALEDDPQRDADLLAQEIEKNGWYEVTDDEKFLAEREKRWKEFLSRMNSPTMVARRGTYLTPYGWRKENI